MSQQGLLIMKPFAVTDATLVSSTVPEDDAAPWSSTATYANGAMVMLASTHSVYENSLDGNINKSPDAHPDIWTRVRATNRWRCLDRKNSARTAQAEGMAFVFAPGTAIGMLAFVGLVNAASVRGRMIDPVYGTVWDQTQYPGPAPVQSDPWEWAFGEWTNGKTLALFTGLPSFPNAQLHVELVGGPDLALGHLIYGQPRVWGQGVAWGVRLGRAVYSKIEPNKYGELELLKRPTAKKPSFEVLLRRHELDPLMDFLDTIDAQVCLFVIADLWECMTLVGVVQNADALPRGLSDIVLDMELLEVV